MSYRIQISSAAERDLIHAADHIEFILKNPKAADDLLNKAEEQINSLSEFPQKFQLVNDSILSSWGIHSIIIDSYLAFYIISEKNKLVIIIRFLFQKSNWKSILLHENPALNS